LPGRAEFEQCVVYIVFVFGACTGDEVLLHALLDEPSQPAGG
jgi:hypothetical protein